MCLCVAVCLATILNHILLVRIAVATTSKWKKGLCLFEWQTLIQPPSCCSHQGIDNNRCACLRNCAFPKCNRPATDQQKFNQTECRKALKVSGPSYAFQRSQKGADSWCDNRRCDNDERIRLDRRHIHDQSRRRSICYTFHSISRCYYCTIWMMASTRRRRQWPIFCLA